MKAVKYDKKKLEALKKSVKKDWSSRARDNIATFLADVSVRATQVAKSKRSLVTQGITDSRPTSTTPPSITSPIPPGIDGAKPAYDQQAGQRAGATRYDGPTINASNYGGLRGRLIQIAQDGGQRPDVRGPGFNEDLAKELVQATSPWSPTYDETFTDILESLRPQWFRRTLAPAASLVRHPEREESL